MARNLAALAVLAELVAGATPNAYFLLTYDMLSRPDWPESYANYSLFIASPTHFDAQLVQQVHSDVPGSRVLAYWDTVSVPYLSSQYMVGWFVTMAQSCPPKPSLGSPTPQKL